MSYPVKIYLWELMCADVYNSTLRLDTFTHMHIQLYTWIVYMCSHLHTLRYIYWWIFSYMAYFQGRVNKNPIRKRFLSFIEFSESFGKERKETEECSKNRKKNFKNLLERKKEKKCKIPLFYFHQNLLSSRPCWEKTVKGRKKIQKKKI